MRDCTELHGSSWADFRALRGTPPTTTLLFSVTAITWNLQNQNALAYTSGSDRNQPDLRNGHWGLPQELLGTFPPRNALYKAPHTWNTCVG